MTISRLSLPQDFEDRISKRMLTAPVPAFFWAKLFKLAGVQFALEGVSAAEMGLTPERSPQNQGAPPRELASLQLMLEDPSGQSSVILVSDELSVQGQGHTIRFNRPVYSGGGYTIASRRRNASTSLSTTPIDFSAEQVYLTLDRLNGPFASGGTVPQPYAIDKLDAKRSVHDLARLAASNLEYDRQALLDGIGNSLAEGITESTVASAVNYVLPGRGRKTADTQLLAPGDAEFDLETLRRAERTLINRSVPRLPNGKYMAVITPMQADQLMLDQDYKDLAKFFPEKNPLHNDFVGDIGSVVIYRSATLTVDTATVSGNSIQHGIMLGMEAMGYGIGEPLEVITSTDDNYGQQAKFMWQSMEAFGVFDNRYGVGMYSD